MQAAVVHAFDAPPRYTTFADPVAADGEKLVTVTAAALHPIVKALANGSHYGSTGELPFIPGVDGAGRLDDGTRVYFGMSRSPFGTFCERALASKFFCLPLPAELDDATAAAIANPAMSSWAALMGRADGPRQVRGRREGPHPRSDRRRRSACCADRKTRGRRPHHRHRTKP
jgi:NADPH:quinone reductase-like Zn-dependent oxidoreductase